MAPVRPITPWWMPAPSRAGPAAVEQQIREIRGPLASLRLDSVLAVGFSLSRGKAAEAVTSGKVQVNWTDCQKPDRPVAQGDTLTLRGLGKCVLEEVGHQTKKGRVFVTLKRYL